MALPWLESVPVWAVPVRGKGRTTRAANDAPLRLGVVFSGNGFHRGQWWAEGSGREIQLEHISFGTILGKDGKVVPEITAAEAQAAIEAGTIEGGMIPKVETCLKALNAGVEAATIIDGRVPHAILIELFTRGGVGTQIIKA